MTSYYTEVRNANKDIDYVIQRRQNFNIHALILEITNKHAVGKKVILDRIETHKKFDKSIIVINEEVQFK